MNFWNIYPNFQEKIKKLREDWQYVKNRGGEMTSQDPSIHGAAASVARETAGLAATSPKVHTGKRSASA
jgi:hypothetical protein